MKTKLLLMFMFLTITLQAQTNLVPNGNFENWTSSSQPDKWFRSFSGLVFQSSSAQNGSSSTKMQITSGTFNFINSEFFPVVAGKSYRITMYHKLVTGTFSAIDLSLYHQPGTFKTEITKKTDAVTSSTEWRKIEFDYTPTVSESIEVDIWTTGTLNSEILVDNVSVVDVATIGAAYTLIPDVNFEKKLISLGHDSGTPDGKVLTSNIASVTSLDVSYSSITDLKGIQDFVSLKTLNCNSNGLSSLDITKNVALSYLNCFGNQLTTLELSKNVALTRLDSYVNKLTTLDLSKNLALRELYCHYNQLTTLDLSENVALLRVECQYNKLTTLDLSKIVALFGLDVTSNQLTTLDLSKNVALSRLDCKNNQLTSLNLKNGKNTLLTNSGISLSSNPNLSCILVDDTTYANTNWADKKDYFTFFSPYDCSLITQIPDVKFEDKLIVLGIDTDGKNGVVLNSSIATITTLDVTNSGIINFKGIEGFKSLTTLNCSGNQLKKLDLSKNTTIATLNCSNNPSLTCIQVGDIAAAEKWNTTKDVTANFSLDCTIYTLIPDTKFEDKLIALGLDKDGKNGKVATESIIGITSLSVSSSSIIDLTGIQDFAALKELNCGSNQLSSLDVSKNVALIQLYCYSNKLTTLDLSKNVALTTLDVRSNQLTTLDLSKNLALNNLYCGSNKLTSPDLSKNVALRTLYCEANQLNTLDLSKNVALIQLYCYSNKLTTLDLSKNVALTTIDVKSNQLTTLDLSKNVALNNLYCGSNQLNSIDLSENVSLKTLSCHTNQLTTLDLSKNVALNELFCNNNQLTKLDLSKNVSLKTLSCNTNQLTSLDLSKNVALTTVYCYINQLSTIDLSKNVALTTFYSYDNKLTTLDLSKNVALTWLDVRNNKFLTINLKNGKNTLITTNSINLTGNANLKCILVDDVTYATVNWAGKKDATASFNATDCTLFTLIPDTNFEQKLIDLGIDTDGKNGKVITSSIVSLTKLNVSNSSITNLTGIEDFTSLNELACETNGLTTINLAKNEALVSLDCSNNKLTSLDVTKNTTLTSLSCGSNQLKTIDVSKNIQLQSLSTSQNLLEQLNFTNNIKLESIVCTNNLLSTLDLSKNVKITTIDCSYNKLKSLNLRNGNNAFGTGMMFVKNFTNNPALTCIEVDDAYYCNTNWPFFKDATASYSIDCKFSLPSNNFAIESKGETCLNSNNGEINITATAAYGYKATINSTSYTFTNNSLKVTNLAQGSYTVTITIPGETFEQIFTINIPKGANITGKSSRVAEKIAVEIATGTAPYTVFLNGVEQFETNATSFTVDAKTSGLLEVKTAKACEGIYAKEISALDGIFSAFPNPTSGAFEIKIPTTQKEVNISIYTLEGKLISNRKYSVENGKVQLSLDDQPAGIYMTKVELDRPEFIKIIKK